MLGFTLLFICPAVAQDNKIIPSAPEASALAKYINYPVGYNTGVPNIGVPLYEIRAGSLTLPISLSYHAGGLRADQKPTNVGVGWSLSTNLQISRSVNGGDDLKNNNDPLRSGYYYNSYGPMYDVCPTNSCYPYLDGPELLDLTAGAIDGEPDRFYYTLLGKSGVFYFQKYANAVRAVTIPYTGIQIELVGTNAFKVTDTDGTVYWFGSRQNPSGTAFTESTYTQSTATSHVVTWKCSEIISPSKTDVFEFSYNQRYEVSAGFQERIELHENTSPCQGSSSTTRIIYPNTEGMEGNRDYTQILQEPMYKFSSPKYMSYSLGPDAGFHIVWEYLDEFGAFVKEDKLYSFPYHATTTQLEGLVLDRITFRGGYAQFNETNQLYSIKIYNEHEEEIKTFSFIQSYAGSCEDSYTFSGGENMRSEYGTRYLDAVEIKKENTVLEKYAFEYYNKICLKNKKGSDAWGGINGSLVHRTHSPSRVPSQEIYGEFVAENNCNNSGPLTFTIGAGDEDAVELYMKSGILTRIIYPTGGYTDFLYEANKYKNELDEIKTAGGLRIEQIKHYDGNGNIPVFEKRYKYGPNEDGTGILKLVPDLNSLEGGFKFMQQMRYIDLSGWNEQTQFWNYFTTEATEDRTTYLSSTVRDLTFSSGAPVHYTEVAEYQQDMGAITGKTVYRFDEDVYNGFNPSYFVPGTNLTIEAGDWHMGKLKFEIQYKYLGNNEYDWVREKSYDYLTHEKDEQVLVHQAFLKNVYNLSGNMLRAGISYSDFQENIYGIRVGTMLLSYETEKWKEAGQELSSTTNYYYDKLSTTYNPLENLQPSRITTTLSTGEAKTKYIYYPTDYTPGSQPFVDNLMDNNMIDYPVEQITTITNTQGEKVAAGQINTYNPNGLTDKTYVAELASTKPLSQFDLLKSGSMDNAYQEKLSFSYDDHSNPVSIQPKDNVPITYIWDYNKLYPVAEIKNAGINEVAYTSFEADGAGGWTGINSANISSHLYLITGKNHYDLTGSSLSKSGLNVGESYIVTYWSRQNSAFNVNGIPGTALRSITIMGENWTCYGHKVVHPAGGTITVTGSGVIDELRLYPARAQMTTYSYTTLLGMNAQCDQNNRILHYEYELGRLGYIYDENGNVLKKFCYNYAGQQQDCAVTTNTDPNWEVTGNTRCKPCPADNNYTYDILQQEERDNNPASTTYYQTRWMNIGFSTQCQGTDWQNTTTPPRCVVDANSYNTGDLEQEQRDMHPCSPTYNQTRWEFAGTDFNACPLPVVYAKLAIENEWWDEGSHYGDIVLHLYRDEACTIPATTAFVTVNYVQKIYAWNSNVYENEFTENDVIDGGVLIYDAVLDEEWEEGGIFYYNSYVYELLSGNGYIIADL